MSWNINMDIDPLQCCNRRDPHPVSECQVPKPVDFKVGDYVEVKSDPLLHGPIVAIRPQDEEPYEIDDVSGGVLFMSGDVLRKRERPAPKLKVGDRVRIIKGDMKGEQGVVDLIGASSVDIRVSGRLFLTYLDSLELLPPEPAKPMLEPEEELEVEVERMLAKYTASGRPIRRETATAYVLGQREVKARNAKPVTATEASILARNQTDPMRDAERYLERKLLKDVLKPVYTLRHVHPQVLQDMKLEAIEPGQVIYYDEDPAENSGWMPAGTYMPLKTEPQKSVLIAQKARLPYQRDRVTMGAYGRCDGGNGDSFMGIERKIPTHSRRLPSRTLTWGPYAEWDNLEDA